MSAASRALLALVCLGLGLGNGACASGEAAVILSVEPNPIPVVYQYHGHGQGSWFAGYEVVVHESAGVAGTVTALRAEALDTSGRNLRSGSKSPSMSRTRTVTVRPPA